MRLRRRTTLLLVFAVLLLLAFGYGWHAWRSLLREQGVERLSGKAWACPPKASGCDGWRWSGAARMAPACDWTWNTRCCAGPGCRVGVRVYPACAWSKWRSPGNRLPRVPTTTPLRWTGRPCARPSPGCRNRSTSNASISTCLVPPAAASRTADWTSAARRERCFRWLRNCACNRRRSRPSSTPSSSRSLPVGACGRARNSTGRRY